MVFLKLRNMLFQISYFTKMVGFFTRVVSKNTVCSCILHSSVKLNKGVTQNISHLGSHVRVWMSNTKTEHIRPTTSLHFNHSSNLFRIILLHVKFFHDREDYE